MKKLTKAVLSLSICFAVLFSCFTFNSVSAQDNPTGAPLTLELKDVQGSGADYIELDLGKLEISGTHLGLRVNPVYAIDQNGGKPKWTMFRIILTDSEGNTYNTDSFQGASTTMPGVSMDGTRVDITWMYNYIWPLQGFYGTVYLPWAKLNGGSDADPTKAPKDIVKIRIQHNSDYVTARREMLAHFFCLTDATLTENNQALSIGDVRVLETFEANSVGVQENLIYDFANADLENAVWSTNKAMNARFANSEEEAKIQETFENMAKSSWESNFSTSGQPFEFTPETNETGRMLKWTYGSYYDEYVPTANSYGSLTVSLSNDESAFTDAKGLTLWVHNPQPYYISFNLEFGEQEDGGVERWNLNTPTYATLYFYDEVTGEEFSMPTLHVAYIPANFKGWVRIPFSNYTVPSWSAANAFSDGVYEPDAQHPAIYITSQFVLNDNVVMYFDNIGVYYNDFEVGTLFDRKLPSIADCLKGE